MRPLQRCSCHPVVVKNRTYLKTRHMFIFVTVHSFGNQFFHFNPFLRADDINRTIQRGIKSGPTQLVAEVRGGRHEFGVGVYWTQKASHIFRRPVCWLCMSIYECSLWSKQFYLHFLKIMKMRQVQEGRALAHQIAGYKYHNIMLSKF